jgi:heme-binding NEAT domain protein
MKRLFLIVAIALLGSFYVNPLSTDAALVDGTYTINYQVNKPDSSSASMANDYFAKPAKLIVQNGAMKVQITIKNSAWVTELNPPGGLTIVSTNPGADQRVVQFSINNFNPLRVGMTIDIDDINYHHSYGTDFVFFENSIQLVEAAPKPQQNTQPNTGSQSSGTNQSGTSASQGSASSGSTQGVTTNNNSSTSNASSSSDNSNTSEQNSQGEEGEESADGKQTEEGQEENPDTSDSFPFVYVLMLLVAIIVLVKNKNILKN